MSGRDPWHRLVVAGGATAAALTLHTAVNASRMRRPDPDGAAPVIERVSLLLPVRDEAHQVAAGLAAVLAQTGVPDLEVLVLDDGSTDGTAAAVRAAAGGDPRVRVLAGAPLPAGWLGKPHACAQLADAATGSVLVFLDADVRLRPPALAATVGLLREARLDLVSPYPMQETGSVGERLVQPLLQWSWLTTLPLRLAERSRRDSLAAANGQLLAVDAAAYRRAGGHSAVRDQVLEDIALVRAVKRAGGRGGVVDGSRIASCRMYEGWAQVQEGYTKSLWAAFGTPVGAAAVFAGLGTVYVVPAVAALAGSPAGAAGYAAGVGGRVVAARASGGRVFPDALAHPVSITLFGWLTARSWWGRGRGTLTWKGRGVVVAAMATLALAGCSGAGPGAASADLVAARPSGAATEPSQVEVAPVPVGTVGSLVEGYPVDSLPPPEGATVTGSVFDPSGRAPDGRKVAQVSLTGTTPAPGRSVLAFYRELLDEQGFAAVDGVNSGSVASVTFSRSGGNELLVVAITDRGDVRSFSVGGTLSR